MAPPLLFLNSQRQCWQQSTVVNNDCYVGQICHASYVGCCVGQIYQIHLGAPVGILSATIQLDAFV
eukprot:scaffold187094_cov30-Prasinocladus_malaysianus.AAC.1